MTYLQHRSQYDGSPHEKENCTPTSLANVIRVVTAGRRDFTGGWVRAQLPRDQEENPLTPGWSLVDADRVAAKLSVPFDIGTGGWAGVVAAHNAGYPVVLQGVSRVFTSGCSGEFDGAHCVCIYPESHSDGARWMLGDPICPKARWESIRLLASYATTFSASIRYAVMPIASKTYSQSEYDKAVLAAKALGIKEAIEAKDREIATRLNLTTLLD